MVCSDEGGRQGDVKVALPMGVPGMLVVDSWWCRCLCLIKANTLVAQLKKLEVFNICVRDLDFWRERLI